MLILEIIRANQPDTFAVIEAIWGPFEIDIPFDEPPNPYDLGLEELEELERLMREPPGRVGNV